jgi:DNA repair protein RadA/Sms
MAKTKTQYICQSCGTIHPRWAGKCDDCGAWNSLVEEISEAAAPKGLSKGKGAKLGFSTLGAQEAMPPRLTTANSEMDRVLGGGLVQGSAILLGGDPGIGKSTLLLQITASLAQSGAEVAYISGEESIAQVQLRAVRLGLNHAPVALATGNSVRDILTSLEAMPHLSVVVIDSIQTMFIDSLDSAPGTVAQVRACANELVRYAKKRNVSMILVGHVTKDGQIAGPRVLEHMVDCVLYFEGERGHLFRILRTVKNRFGATDEIGVFEMTGLGLTEVSNPSSLFLSEREIPVSGSAVLAGIEGTRPVLLEMQALVAPSAMANPRRAVVGWDGSRLSMLLAVLETRLGLRFSDREVYLNVTGGLRVNEPAADVAAAAALISSLLDIPVPHHTIFFGEIGLSGEIRPVSRQDIRLREAAKLGFERACCPLAKAGKENKKDKNELGDLGLGISPLHHVQDVLDFIRANA